jgi:hypothetical protein
MQQPTYLQVPFVATGYKLAFDYGVHTHVDRTLNHLLSIEDPTTRLTDAH